MFLLASCGSNVPVSFNPDFFEFVPRGGYIINAAKDKKFYCNEPAIRNEFAALSKAKIIELRNILRNAVVPKRSYKGKTNLLKNLNNTIKKMNN